jgi:hypothetical protein
LADSRLYKHLLTIISLPVDSPGHKEKVKFLANLSNFTALLVKVSINRIACSLGYYLVNAECPVSSTEGALPGYREDYLSAWIKGKD